MIRRIISLGVILVAGILVYNYFLGTPAEKTQSKEIFSKFKEVGKSVGGLLRSEKDKFDSGKYDKALGQVKDVFGRLKDKASELDDKYSDRLSNLEGDREELEGLLDRIKDLDAKDINSLTDSEKEEKENFVNKFKDFYKDMEGVVGEMEKQ